MARSLIIVHLATCVHDVISIEFIDTTFMISYLSIVSQREAMKDKRTHYGVVDKF